jgi:hypothetical protein
VDTATLFGNAIVALAAQPCLGYQDLRSKDMKSNTKYIKATTGHLNNNNLYGNMTSTSCPRLQSHQALNNLPRQACCLHAEKQCQKRVSLWWLRKLTQARLYHNFPDGALRRFENNLQEPLINHCARLSPRNNSATKIAVKEVKAPQFSAWDKPTASSPLWIHLGHYKALI